MSHKVFAMVIICATLLLGTVVNGASLSTVEFNLEVPQSQFTDESENDYHACLGNETGNYFTGFSFSGDTPKKTTIDTPSTSYKTSIKVGPASSDRSQKVFMAYSKGSCGNMELRRNIIDNNKFLEGNNPSFSYRMPENYYIEILLDYDKLNITENARISKGQHQVSINYLGETDGKINMDIDV